VSETYKKSTKLMVIMSILSIAILLAGPVGYKSGVLPLQPALLSLILSLGIAVVALIASFSLFLLVKERGFSPDRKFLLMAFVISLVPSLLVGAKLKIAASVPEIHDITTDTLNPPMYEEIVDLRKGASNSLVYEYQGSAEKLSALQAAAYPDLKPLSSKLSVKLALVRAVSILEEQGLVVVNVNAVKGIVEATATSFWYGFKDDVVVRVQATDQGSRIDLRSVSRVGRSDVGINAARIRTFSKKFIAFETN
jgi:uncharacterized protein (DUF1499 family)